MCLPIEIWVLQLAQKRVRSNLPEKILCMYFHSLRAQLSYVASTIVFSFPINFKVLFILEE